MACYNGCRMSMYESSSTIYAVQQTLRVLPFLSHESYVIFIEFWVRLILNGLRMGRACAKFVPMGHYSTVQWCAHAQAPNAYRRVFSLLLTYAPGGSWNLDPLWPPGAARIRVRRRGPKTPFFAPSRQVLDIALPCALAQENERKFSEL
jgi:hypothetical protein